MTEPRCADCRFFHKLKHNFEVGKGFEESHCCTIMIEHDFEPSVKDITWVQEVEEDSRCEMFTKKGADGCSHGKWIDYRDEGFVECPFCGHATNCEDDIDELHYCFYCGAKMVEPQESEVKE